MKLAVLFLAVLVAGCAQEKPTAVLTQQEGRSTKPGLQPMPYHEEEDDPLVYISGSTPELSQCIVYIWPSGLTNVVVGLQDQYQPQAPTSTCPGGQIEQYNAVFTGTFNPNSFEGSGTFTQTSGNHADYGTVTGGYFVFEIDPMVGTDFIGYASTDCTANLGCGPQTIHPAHVIQVHPYIP